MEYAISKTVSKTFKEAVESIIAELKKEGFGVISEIDLKEKFKEKLGIEFRQYTILGACNPALAHQAIQQEARIGVMLPCNVLVQETGNGQVEISAINPLTSIGITGNETLQSIATEVSGKLKAAVDRM